MITCGSIKSLGNHPAIAPAIAPGVLLKLLGVFRSFLNVASVEPLNLSSSP